MKSNKRIEHTKCCNNYWVVREVSSDLHFDSIYISRIIRAPFCFITFLYLSRNSNVLSFHNLSGFSAKNFPIWSFVSPKLLKNYPMNKDANKFVNYGNRSFNRYAAAIVRVPPVAHDVPWGRYECTTGGSARCERVKRMKLPRCGLYKHEVSYALCQRTNEAWWPSMSAFVALYAYYFLHDPRLQRFEGTSG